MLVPYTPEFVAALLDGMADDRLAVVEPIDFCRWPAQIPLPHQIGRDLIAQERAKRANVARSEGR